MKISCSLHFPDRVVGTYEYIDQHHAYVRRVVITVLAARLKPSCTHSNNLPVR